MSNNLELSYSELKTKIAIIAEMVYDNRNKKSKNAYLKLMYDAIKKWKKAKEKLKVKF